MSLGSQISAQPALYTRVPRKPWQGPSLTAERRDECEQTTLTVKLYSNTYTLAYSVMMIQAFTVEFILLHP